MGFYNRGIFAFILDSKKSSDLEFKNPLTNLFLCQLVRFHQNYSVASMLILSCCINWSENLVKGLNWLQEQKPGFFQTWKFLSFLETTAESELQLERLRVACV